jgi:hypothetical protein
MKRILVAATVGMLSFGMAVADSPSQDLDPTAVWSTWSGQGQIELRGDFLKDFGVDVVVGNDRIPERTRQDVAVQNLGSLELYAPAGNFARFTDGRIDLVTNYTLRAGSSAVSLRNLIAVPTVDPSNGHPALQLLDGSGTHLFTMTHLHVLSEPDRELLQVHNADLVATAALAERLGVEVLENMAIGMVWLDLNLHIPPGANTTGRLLDEPQRGLSCSGRPFWPQEDPSHEVDVGLIAIGNVAYQGRQPGTDRIKVAPSATLKSLGFGDAIWIPKFSSNGLWPYTPEDQHPYLVWNMYRIADGRIEQLGTSGVKHAFLTLNFNCSVGGGSGCGSANVLWPGCEDVYSSGTNDSNSNQGPRYDINPDTGLFFSTGSFFDPNSTGSQQNFSSSYENRLMVDENELSTPGAGYFLDSWYVVLHDINIWNSMGYHPISPTPVGNGWTFNPDPFIPGPIIGEWVPEGTSDPNESHEVIRINSTNPGANYPDNMPQGHLRVLVRATEVAPDRWRYNYAIQNYDFDRGIDEVRIPLPAGGQVFDTFFGAPEVDGHQTVAWSVQREGGELVFTAPPPTPRPPPEPPASNELTWFSLFNFEVETDVPPTRGEVRMRAAEAGTPDTVVARVVAPGLAETLFFDGFETRN